jgi:hypothetical protein
MNIKDFEDIQVPERTETEKADDIKKNVNNIIAFCLRKENLNMRNNDIDQYKQICMRTFQDFHQNYPTLFFSIIENPSSFPLYRLNEMLNLKKKIEENKVDEKEASVHLGKKYYNEFVKDTVSKLDNK